MHGKEKAKKNDRMPFPLISSKPCKESLFRELMNLFLLHVLDYSLMALSMTSSLPERVIPCLTEDLQWCIMFTMKNIAWKLLKEKQLVKNQWMDFREKQYEMPDGRVVEPFYSVHRSDYVVIVARTEEGKYLCVRQYRQGMDALTIEFPAGCMDDKDAGGTMEEKALSCAKRELMEECGYASEHWQYLGMFHENATLSDDKAYLFLAENCRKCGNTHYDENEFMESLLLSEEELQTAIKEGTFPQAMHVLAYELAGKRCH